MTLVDFVFVTYTTVLLTGVYSGGDRSFFKSHRITYFPSNIDYGTDIDSTLSLVPMGNLELNGLMLKEAEWVGVNSKFKTEGVSTVMGIFSTLVPLSTYMG